MTDEERQDAPEGIEDTAKGPAAETGGGRAVVRAPDMDTAGPGTAPERAPPGRGGQGRGGRGGRREGVGQSRGRSQGRQQRSRTTVEVDVNAWKPKTRLGQLVKEGKITSLSQALGSGLPLREAMVVDIFLPEIEDDVLDINMVQRMTDSGRRVKFSITTVVGDRNGFIGMGRAKGKEVGPTIRKAIDNAKLNLIEVRRGCGSWDCGCGGAHSLPYAVTGKAGSVEVTLKPAPRGAGLSAGDVAQRILSLAGFQDVRSFATGQTRTTVNFAAATFEALVSLTRTRAPPGAESGPDPGPVQAEAPAGGE